MKTSLFAQAAFTILFLSAFSFAAYTATVEAPITDATLYTGGYSYIIRSAQFDGMKGPFALHVENLTKVQGGSADSYYGSYWAGGNDIGEIVSSSYIGVQDGGISSVKSFRNFWNESMRTGRVMSLGEVLGAALGKSATITTAKGTRSGTLLWHSEWMVGLSGDAGLVMANLADITELSVPSLPNYSAFDEANISKSSYGVDIYGSLESAGQKSLKMRYVSSGPSYAPNFRIELPSDSGSGTAKVTASFHIQNVQNDLKNVRLKVVVGAPHFASLPSPIPYPAYNSKLNNAPVAMESAGASDSFGGGVVQSESAEYYVYSFSDPVSINAGEEANVQAFTENMPFKRENLWETYNAIPQKYVLVNNTGTAPLAAGVFRVYMNDEFAGEARTYSMTQQGYNAPINFADLYEVKAKREIDSQTAKQGNAAVATYTGKLTMENTASRQITLKVREQMDYGDKVELVSASIQPKKLSGNRLEWEVIMQPKEKLVVDFVYTVTTYDRQYY